MNGRQYNFTSAGAWRNVKFLGNGFTIYNFRSDYTDTQGRYNVGINTTSSGCSINNITFSNMFLRGTEYIGLYPQPSNLTANHVQFKDCYVYCWGNGKYNGMSAMMFGYLSNRHSGHSYFDYVSSQNCVSIGNSHVGGTFGMYDGGTFTNCFSDGDLVVSQGGHSGTLAACSNVGNVFRNCWANSTIYGNATVGGFTGSSLGDQYTDCFSCGVVEGNKWVAGFSAEMVGSSTSTKSTATNCYTTCMVGMNYSGNELGGFVSILRNAMLTRCYAAGEVGSIDTDINSTDSGGFAANCISGISAVEWAYDMQTSGMKNRALGTYFAGPTLACMKNPDGSVASTSYDWLVGYSTNAMASGASIFSTGYTYTKGLYPQISSMSAHADPKFRAASAASTATVFCDAWSELPDATTFDTVRDIVRPAALSSNTPFTSNPLFSAAYVDDPHIVDITWSTDGNKTPTDKETPVVTLPSSSPYYTASLMPGIEWLTVNVTYKDDNGQTATGSRRLRLIPTSFIAAGDDKQLNVSYEDGINKTPLYNHNDGFSATYLDAKTLQSYMESSTAHTDSLKTFSDCSPAASYTDDSASGSVSLPFNASYKTMELGMSISSRDGNEMRISPISSKLTGISPLETADFGIYDLSYKAAIPDGRYLSASKSLAVVGEFSVVYNYNYHGLLAGKNISPHSIFSIQSELEDFNEFDMYAYGDAPIRDGWRFSYWSLDEEGLEPVSQSWFDTYAERIGELNENINLYAQYTRSNATRATLTLVPGIGSYQEHAIGENVMLTGVPGDRIVISSASAPDNWIFDGWAATELGDGTLHKSSTGDWVFTFGEGDASITAEYHPTVFDVSVHRVNKHSREGISEPWEGVQQAGEHYEVSVADGVDASFYNVETAEIRVYDADTGEELALDDLNVTVSDDGTIYAYDMPSRNIRIEITYDTWIQMPETGMPWACVLAAFGSIALSAACIGMMASRYRRSN